VPKLVQKVIAGYDMLNNISIAQRKIYSCQYHISSWTLYKNDTL